MCGKITILLIEHLYMEIGLSDYNVCMALGLKSSGHSEHLRKCTVVKIRCGPDI